MYYNSNFGGQVQQPMPQQMPMYGQGPYPVMDNRLSALEMQMKQGQQNPNLYGGRQQLHLVLLRHKMPRFNLE